LIENNFSSRYEEPIT